MRFLGKSLMGLVLLGLTLGLLGYAAVLIRDAVQANLADEPPQRRARERVFAVNVVPVRLGSETPLLGAFGSVQSRRSLELRSAVAGTVIDLSEDFVDGGEVSAGQLLVRLDPSDAQAALDRAESDLLDAQSEQTEAAQALILAEDELVAARAQVSLREVALKRQQDLVTRNVGTAAAVEEAELAVSSAQQSVLTKRQSVATAKARINQAETARQRAQIALDEARRDLADTEIRAEFSGTLSDVTLVAGRLVSGNETLAQLVDASALEVAFRVSTAQYARLLDDSGHLLELPMTATLDVYGNDLTASGRLARASAAVGEGQTGRLIYAELDSARGFRPGDFVTVSVEEPMLERVARLPSTAVDAASTVLVVNAENRLEVARVEILRRQGDDVLVRAAGLEGASVVAERTPLLGAGIMVEALAAAPSDDETAQAEPMIALTDERRARLRAAVEGNRRMPEDMRDQVLNQLSQPQVPAQVVERIESRIGG